MAGATMNPYFFVFEVLVYGLLAISLIHARNRGAHAIWQLLAGALFGLALEWATIHQLHAYRYGNFLIMIGGEVPLAIGVAWGVIIYNARLYAETTTLPGWARPILAALLALNIDLSMDAIAIRLGMWDWGQGLDFQYFGVPWANFWAWFWVVFFFSAGLSLFAEHENRVSRWLGPGAALILGLAGVLATNALIVFVIPYRWYEMTIAGVLVIALLLILVLRPRRRPGPLPPPVKWTSLVFHGFFSGAGLLSGAALHPPILLAVSLAMAGAAWRLHAPAS